MRIYFTIYSDHQVIPLNAEYNVSFKSQLSLLLNASSNDRRNNHVGAYTSISILVVASFVNYGVSIFVQLGKITRARFYEPDESDDDASTIGDSLRENRQRSRKRGYRVCDYFRCKYV